MDLQQINDKANDVMVLRLEISALQKELEKEIAKNPKIQDLQDQLSMKDVEKKAKQQEMIDMMKSVGLPGIKTETANYSVQKRISVKLDPTFKKELESRVKNGEEIEPRYQVSETEFMSIRVVKK